VYVTIFMGEHLSPAGVYIAFWIGAEKLAG